MILGQALQHVDGLAEMLNHYAWLRNMHSSIKQRCIMTVQSHDCPLTYLFHTAQHSGPSSVMQLSDHTEPLDSRYTTGCQKPSNRLPG